MDARLLDDDKDEEGSLPRITKRRARFSRRLSRRVLELLVE
jgi:hypothetical protein